MDGFEVIAGEQAMGGGAPPGAEGAAVLIVHGPRLGRLFFLPPGATVIGRDETSDIHLDAEGISTHHARLVRDDEGVVLHDLDDGERRLIDGDVIHLGRASIMFIAGDGIPRRYEEELRRLATVDTLTLAYNRRYFGTILEHELDRARRHDRPVSLLMLGIDGFADYNAARGRIEGDAILRRVAGLARETVRHGAVVARHESDVFVAILPSTRTEQATAVGETLRQNVARTLPISISISVVSWDGVMGADALVSQAVERLSSAKERS